MNSRTAKMLSQLWEKERLDAFVLFSREYDNRPNVQYLSGFSGSTAAVVLMPQKNYLVVDSRYFVQAEEESDFIIGRIPERDPWPVLTDIFQKNRVRTLGFEMEKLTVDWFRRLDSLGVSLKGYKDFFKSLRSVKDEKELSLIRKSCEIASRAFNEVYPRIEPGMTEAGLAAELAYSMRKYGAENLAKGHFVVASGVRGERPHGVFSNKVIEKGDFITMDFGAVYKGYFSDITRTVAVGPVDSRLEEIYRIVLEANRIGIEGAGSRISGRELDERVRSYISSQGFGEYFTHSTGHGIGLELHEFPNVNFANVEYLPVNSVITIEPGIYLPGIGGVRIEDDVVIGERQCEVLSFAEKELVIL
jgi:Xaa-Pro aminopeptidase